MNDSRMKRNFKRMQEDFGHDIYTRITKYVTPIVMRILDEDPYLAEEAIDVTRIKAVLFYDTNKDGAKFLPWIARIATNESLQLRRSEKHRQYWNTERLDGEREQEENNFDYRHEQGTQDPAFTKLEDRDYVHELLLRATPFEKHLLYAKYVNGYTYDELALATEESTGNVKTLIHRACKKIRKTAT